jgi:hypothetical protein
MLPGEHPKLLPHFVDGKYVVEETAQELRERCLRREGIFASPQENRKASFEVKQGPRGKRAANIKPRPGSSLR